MTTARWNKDQARQVAEKRALDLVGSVCGVRRPFRCVYEGSDSGRRCDAKRRGGEGCEEAQVEGARASRPASCACSRPRRSLCPAALPFPLPPPLLALRTLTTIFSIFFQLSRIASSARRSGSVESTMACRACPLTPRWAQQQQQQRRRQTQRRQTQQRPTRGRRPRKNNQFLIRVSSPPMRLRDGDGVHHDGGDGHVTGAGARLRDRGDDVHAGLDLAEHGVLRRTTREPVKVRVVGHVDEELRAA